MSKIETLSQSVLDWANEKGILRSDASPKQFMKILEETGETCGAILKNKPEEIKDGIGDMAVTVIIYAGQKGINLRHNSFSPPFVTRTDDQIIHAFTYMITETHLQYAMSTLHELAYNHNLILEECLETAWDEIKNRAGKTVNGIFIKD